MKETYFHIEQLIELIKDQNPERIDVIEQLEKSEVRKWLRQPYIHLVPGYRPNQPGSEWQFDENLILEHDTEGTIVLDLLKDGRIGGIEFLNQIRY